ncbi:MAG: hypothetical protein K6E78_10635 [Treponema sp.]|nr:hypothetical protein [Treponema sp.]
MKISKAKSFLLMLMGASLLSFSACNLDDLVNDAMSDSTEEESDDATESGSDSLELSQEESKAKLAALAGKQGIEIKSKHKFNDDDEEETWIYGEKDNTIWVITGDSGHAYKKEGDRLLNYSANLDDEGNLVYAYNYSLTSDQLEDQGGVDKLYSDLRDSMNISFYFANAYDGHLTKGDTRTVAGRSCTHYSYSYYATAYGNFATLNYQMDIDKETGITMKAVWKASTNEDSAEFYHEVTSFKTTNVQVPNLPEEE